QLDGVAARGRAESATTTTEDIGATRAVTRTAAALLATELLAGHGDIGAVLDRVRAGHALQKLVAHHALDQIGARFEPEHCVVERDLAGRLTLEGCDLEFHYTLSPLAAALKEPGSATPSGRGFLTASRIWIQPPLAPGTEP